MMLKIEKQIPISKMSSTDFLEFAKKVCIPMISMPDSNIKLIAGESITAGDKLEYQPSTGKVIKSRNTRKTRI